MSPIETSRVRVLCLIVVAGCGSGSNGVGPDGMVADALGDGAVVDVAPLPSGWAVVANTDANWLRSVWAQGSDAWAVGDASTILEGHGASWTRRSELSVASLDLHGVWGASASDVWAVGTQGSTGRIAHYDGTSWTLLSPSFGAGLNAVSGTAATDVWAVGDGPSIFHWNGSSWTSSDASAAGAHGLVGVTARGSAAFAVTDSTLVIAWTGSSWTPYTQPNAPGALTGIWSETDLWTTGLAGGVWNTTGGPWNTIVEPAMSNPMTGVWGSSDGNIWAVGFYGNIGHWNGASFSLEPIINAQNLFAVWGTSAGDIWTVGEGGMIIHGSP